MSKRWTVFRFPSEPWRVQRINFDFPKCRNSSNFWSWIFGSGKKGDTEMFFGSFPKIPWKESPKNPFCCSQMPENFRESSELPPTNQLATPICSPHPNVPSPNWFFFKKKRHQRDSSTKKRKRSSFRIWCLAMVDHNKKKLNKRPRIFYTLRYLPGTTIINSDFHTLGFSYPF